VIEIPRSIAGAGIRLLETVMKFVAEHLGLLDTDISAHSFLCLQVYSTYKDSMGMGVIFYDVIQTMPLGTAKYCQSLQELLETADFVTLHVPETPETKNMIGAKEIAYIKKGGYLINGTRISHSKPRYSC
jgi:D-isomer specific 2-hydroxyacid dehydrogenase, NAD binding domain